MIRSQVTPACFVLSVAVFGTATLGTTDFDPRSSAQAQFPTAVTTFHAPAPHMVVGQPVVTYTPRRAGLFGLRTVYRPEMGVLVSSAPAPVATSTFFAPSAPFATVPTTTFFAPSAPFATVPTTTFFAPATPVTSFMVPTAPVTTFMAPATPVTSFMVPTAPATSFSAPIHGSPAPVTTFLSPSVSQPIPTQGFSNFVPGY